MCTVFANLYLRKEETEVTQSCPTLCDPMDCSLAGSSLHGIFQVRILEWVAISFSRGSFQPRDRTQVSRIEGRLFTVWATRETLYIYIYGDGSYPVSLISNRTFLPSQVTAVHWNKNSTTGKKLTLLPLTHLQDGRPCVWILIQISMWAFHTLSEICFGHLRARSLLLDWYTSNQCYANSTMPLGWTPTGTTTRLTVSAHGPLPLSDSLS